VDQSSVDQNRRSRRSPVFLKASIEVDGATVPVTLRNLSGEGALVEGAHLPLEGWATWFERNDLRIKGRVVWVEGRFAGIRFDQPLKRDEVLRHVPRPKQKLEQSFKRPGLACRPITDYERRMLEVWMTPLPVARPGD
jgi:hypothetical protein